MFKMGDKVMVRRHQQPGHIVNINYGTALDPGWTYYISFPGASYWEGYREDQLQPVLNGLEAANGRLTCKDR